MAPQRMGGVATAKADALWREAWVGSPHVGRVQLVTDKGTGQEQLVVHCEAVAAEYGADAQILDDGRTFSVCVGDRVAFGVVEVPGKAPIAVNVWRTPASKKRKNVDTDEVDEMNMWEEWQTNDFNYAQDHASTSKAESAEGTGWAPSRNWGEATPLPEALQGKLIGVVRHQSNVSGHYFIECPEVVAEYKRDATIKLHDMPRGIGIGDAITFEISAPRGEDAAPISRNIRKATGEKAEAAIARGFARDRAFKGGKGFKGGGKYSRAPLPTVRMKGIVKKKSNNTGRHFVFCQDIFDVCGQDAQIPVEEIPTTCELKVGDHISFDVEEFAAEGKGGSIPMARNVEVIGRPGRKTLLAAADMGDGEDELDGEDLVLEEAEDEEEPVQEEVPVDDEGELEDAESAYRIEAEAAKAASARLQKKAKKAAEPKRPEASKKESSSKKVRAAEAPAAEEPTSVEGWIAAQATLFAGESRLPKGWIRIRSKSKGLVYFYNVVSGQSSPIEPLS
mmetsp:Transcript_25551/g.56329  ORF Transcript_25551/g.56329 Transcript_25551/m.56329 type:complete len:506 (-) Transcript_25551:141-1658(-)